jgi:hypothetical protein
MSFFNSENVGTADQELAEQYKEMGIPDATYSQATVQAMMGGHFLYQSGMEPSNFTAFGFTEQTPTLASGPNRTLLLYLAATQGKGKTTEEINRSTKQWVKAPTSFEELTMQLTFLMGISTIFFSAESALVPSLNTFQKSLAMNRMCVKTRIVSDKLYASKILYAIDTRTQRWLRECKIAKERSTVDDSIVDFRDLTNDVLNGRFSMDLPPVFAEPEQMKDGPTTLGGPAKKKAKKSGKKGEEERLLNKSPFEEFKMKKDKNWQIFCGDVQKERPDWGSNQMCHRWQIRGYCFEDCFNGESHVAKEKVPAEKVKEFGSWMKKARESK